MDKQVVKYLLLGLILCFLLVPNGVPFGTTTGFAGISVQHVQAFDLSGGSSCNSDGTVTCWEGATCLLIGSAMSGLILFLGAVVLSGIGMRVVSVAAAIKARGWVAGTLLVKALFLTLAVIMIGLAVGVFGVQEACRCVLDG